MAFIRLFSCLFALTIAATSAQANNGPVAVGLNLESSQNESKTAHIATGSVTASAAVFTQTSQSPTSEPASVSEEAPIPVDYSTTEAALRTFILQGNVDGASHILDSPKLVSLAAGLTFPEELAHLVQKTDRRNTDPDVVAFKALATSALRTCDARKLAAVAVLSLTSDCKCSIFGPQEEDNLIDYFTSIFKDRERMQHIVEADANTDPDFNRGGRKLLVAGGTPVHSFVCAYCSPNSACKPMSWC